MNIFSEKKLYGFIFLFNVLFVALFPYTPGISDIVNIAGIVSLTTFIAMWIRDRGNKKKSSKK